MFTIVPPPACAAMTGMASLRQPVDAFFEAVQVNTDKQMIRRNRLAFSA